MPTAKRPECGRSACTSAIPKAVVRERDGLAAAIGRITDILVIDRASPWVVSSPPGCEWRRATDGAHPEKSVVFAVRTVRGNGVQLDERVAAKVRTAFRGVASAV